MNYSTQQLTDTLDAVVYPQAITFSVTNTLIDSRAVICNQQSLFFALVGTSNNGHHYINELIEKGVRNFVVSDQTFINDKATYFLVKDTTVSLQKMARVHRQQFTIPLIGITGSNGKTIVKEWLATSLENTETPVKTIGSYNSQVGVPLSIFQLNKKHTVGIFEAGISQKGEMEKLQKIIAPTIGIFTNIGSAHESGFDSIEEKITEKIKLFQSCKTVICNEKWAGYFPKNKLFVWGENTDSQLVYRINKNTITLSFQEEKANYNLPFSNYVFIENLLQVLAYHVLVTQSVTGLQRTIEQIQPVAMRLEVKNGIHESILIDDTYNNDPEGMKRAIEFLANQDQRLKKVAIISGYLKSDYSELNEKLKQGNVEELYLIGKEISQAQFDIPNTSFSDVETFLKEINTKQFFKKAILIKGTRNYRFERIVELLQKEFHETILEINLSALQHNLNYFRSKLFPETKIMVMVKAYAYGAGATTVARLMQYNRVDYLGVAYVDEGVELRSNGIETPIMVMNPTEKSTHKFLEYDLEPEVYSFHQLQELTDALDGKQLKIHLKIDTGMHRLGFISTEIDELIQTLQHHKNLEIASIFSHLATADDQKEDKFTLHQIESFKTIAGQIKQVLKTEPIIHILNSAGIQRFTPHQLGMVRLGIGLYGVAVDKTEQKQLQHIGVLKTRISQIKVIPKGQTVGYSRQGKFDEEAKIATIAIGYADGYDRKFSKGKGKVLINGKIAPVVGNVCMDMTMVDITAIDAKEGDEVIIFSNEQTVSSLAESIGTIPYEILTNISERVKRVFVRE